jgi:hypothetical protein
MRLLTPAHANAKTAKNLTQGNYLSFILHLAPHKLSGTNLCPMASRGCAAACLNTAGRGRFDSVKQGRLRKSKLFLEQRAEFLKQLHADLSAALRKAKREGSKCVVRLNGTSDIDWTAQRHDGKNMFEHFPEIQFYDYTKVVKRLEAHKLKPVPNYYLVFSRSESNDADVQRALSLGFNVAAVFDASLMLKGTFNDRLIIDGDAHDLRFLDKGRGVYVGLKAKGDAKRDETGFVLKLHVR